MIRKAVCVLGSVLITTCSTALTEAATILPPDVYQSFKDWQICKGAIIRDNLNTTLSSDQIVDLALSRCKPEEGLFFSASQRNFPGLAQHMLDKQTQNFRVQAAELINSARGGSKINDPKLAWGVCVNSAVQYEAKRQDTPDVAVDHALEACNAEGERVRETIKPTVLGQSADAIYNQAREALREQAMVIVERTRADQPH